MSKFHISPKTGEPGLCRAKDRCPFGGENEHYSSKEEARGAYEAQQEWNAAKQPLLEQWGKVTWLTNDPMKLDKVTPLEVRRTEVPTDFDPDYSDVDETKIYEAEKGMAQRVNELLGTPLATPVFIEDRNDEYWLSEATLDGDGDVTFQAGEHRKTFRSMAAAMQWLAYGDKPSPASIIVPDFSSEGDWRGGTVRVMGEGIVPVTIKPTSLYRDKNSGEASGFYGREVGREGEEIGSTHHRYFSFESHWVEELKP